MLPEVCNFGIFFVLFAIAAKRTNPEASGLDCKEKTSLRLQFRPSSMPGAAGIEN
jgi:hypothetical protein